MFVLQLLWCRDIKYPGYVRGLVSGILVCAYHIGVTDVVV
jgi:hypothetical protein